MRFLIRIVAVLFIVSGGSALYAGKTPKTKEQKAPISKQLATIDGVAITETQARAESVEKLDSLELQNLRAKAIAARNEHEILEAAVDQIIEDKLLQAEAEKQHISKEDLLAEEIQQKVKEPTAEEVEDFYTQNQQRITKPKEEAVPQILKYLKQQRESNLREAFFGRLESEHKVVRMIEPLRFDVNAPDRPSIGSASAPVLLVVFSDFQCPYCKRFSATIKEVTKEYSDKVRVVFRQFPLTNIHANAQKAAEASLCAEAQGHFWEMHDLLFQNQNNLRDEDLKNRAGQLGLNTAAFNTCLDTKQFGGKVIEDVRAGSAAGVEGTPAMFINGRFLYGSRSTEEISQIIDEELAAGQKTAGKSKASK